MQKMFNALKDKRKRILYMLCFGFACLIDQRIKTCTGLDGWLESFRDMTGVVVAILIMSHYRMGEIKKWKLPYIVWSLICAVGIVPALLWGRSNWLYFNNWCVILLDVILFGYILIHTFIAVVLEKKYPKLNVKFAAVWLVMMVLMIVSRSTYIWPLCYLLMFVCFYLTDFTKEEQNDMFQGMLDGIILAFFMLQGWCFVFRPYDEVRYVGVYSNSNLNGLFYLEVLAAVFAKLVYVFRIQANKWVKAYYWIGAGTVLSFIFLTIGRTAWLTAVVIGLIFLVSMQCLQKKRTLIKNGIILVLCTCLTFPLCFGAVRYLPPVFHHPVWFWGEWEETKVHSWDAWNSEKFVDIDEFMDAAVGRIADSVGDLIAQSPLVLRVEAAEADKQVKEAVLTHEQFQDSYLVRKTIYQHYLRHLNLWGHPYEEQGFQLTPTYWIGHAHNIYLQYGTDFGIPVMLLFALLIVWAAVCLVVRIRRECNEHRLGGLLFLLIPAVFGILEYSWGVGSITIFLLFVTWRKVICNEEI